MYRNETLCLDGDSIWGRITLLLSSLLGRPCTGKERAELYESILIGSIRIDQQQEIPVQYMIDEAVMLLNRKANKQHAKKFITLINKLRCATDMSDEIIRFLLLMSKIGPEHANEYDENSSPGFLISDLSHGGPRTIFKDRLVFPKRHFIDQTNLPQRVFESRYSYEKDVLAENSSLSCDSVFRKNGESNKEIQNIIIDDRGRVHPRACDPELRTLCRLRVGDIYYKVSWSEYLRCLTHMLLGEESFLFRRKADGSFNLYKRMNIFLELEDLNLLPRLSLPFLHYANSLSSMNNFLTGFDPTDELSTTNTETPKDTKALKILKRSASEQLWIFRDSIRHAVKEKEGCNSEEIRKLLGELLKMCNVFNHFVELVLHIQTVGAQDMTTLLDVFYIAKITKGQIVSAIHDFCDDVLSSLLQHYAQSVMLWLLKGYTDPNDGVFSIETSNVQEMRWTITEENVMISLKPSILIAECFCKKWLCEGGFQRLIMKCSTSKEMEFEEYNPSIADGLIRQLTGDEIRKALHSLKSDAVGALLDNCFRKIYLSRYTESVRSCVINDFKKTARLLRDVYLCDDDRVTEIFVCALLNAEDHMKLHFYSKNDQNSKLSELMDYLLSRDYSPALVQGFLQLTSLSDEEKALKVRYKPPFPLHVIFTPSVLLNYERIWKLMLRMALECTALEKMIVEKAYDYGIAMIQMRMWNFVRAIRCFFHKQITHIFTKEFQDGLDEVKTVEEAFILHKQFVKKLCRRCLLGPKHVKLWNVLDECLALITEYRCCYREPFSLLKIYKIFNNFHSNVDLFCNAVRRTSVGANYWFSDLLLLADFPGIYTDFYGSTSTLSSAPLNVEDL